MALDPALKNHVEDLWKAAPGSAEQCPGCGGHGSNRSAVEVAPGFIGLECQGCGHVVLFHRPPTGTVTVP